VFTLYVAAEVPAFAVVAVPAFTVVATTVVAGFVAAAVVPDFAVVGDGFVATTVVTVETFGATVTVGFAAVLPHAASAAIAVTETAPTSAR